jgi:hypothetical protein
MIATCPSTAIASDSPALKDRQALRSRNSRSRKLSLVSAVGIARIENRSFNERASAFTQPGEIGRSATLRR